MRHEIDGKYCMSLHSCKTPRFKVRFEYRRVVNVQEVRGPVFVECMLSHMASVLFPNTSGTGCSLLGQPLPEFCANADPSKQEITLNILKKKMECSDGAFYMMDLGRVAAHYHRWIKLLPRVKPFFAIKSNPDDMVIGLLMALGAGFDCASQGEVEVIRGHMERYLAPLRQQNEEQAQTALREYIAKNVIYANPVKLRPHMRNARSHGVEWTTFDSIVELHKVAKEWPDAKLVLQVSPPRVCHSQTTCEVKFGACSGEIPVLLATARKLNLNIVGVSCNGDTLCEEAHNWSETIAYARQVFDMLKRFGYSPFLLDLGGGFKGNNSLQDVQCFENCCALINAALDQYFLNENADFTLIAEPGDYFLGAAVTFAAKVVGKHGNIPQAFQNVSQMKQSDSPQCDVRYYIDDSVYSSFRACCLGGSASVLGYFHQDEKSGRLKKLDDGVETFPSKVYGSGCDSHECTVPSRLMPDLREDDWIVWGDVAAYTRAKFSGAFHQLARPPVFYHVCVDHLHAFVSHVISSHDDDSIVLHTCKSSRMRNHRTMSQKNRR